MDVRFQPFCISPIVLTSVPAYPTIQSFAQGAQLLAGSDLPDFVSQLGTITTVASQNLYSATRLLIYVPGAQVHCSEILNFSNWSYLFHGRSLVSPHSLIFTLSI